MTTPTISELSMIRALPPVNAPPDLKLPTVTKMVPYRGREVVSTPACVNKVKSGPASASLVPRSRGRRKMAWYELLVHVQPFLLHFCKIVTFT